MFTCLKSITVVFLALIVSYSSGQDAIDGCLLSDLTDSEVSRLINERETSEGGEGNTVNVTLQGRFPNCRAIGRTRATGARYRSVTETVQYTGRPPVLTQLITQQVDFVCQTDSVAGIFWGIPSADESFVRLSAPFPDGILSTDPSSIRTDCAECTGTVNATNMDNDPTFHCKRCDSACLEEEQRLCYGDSSTTCCNVYINDVCMNDCPINQVATPESNFECFCNLTCLNGGSPNLACDACNCPDPRFTGPRCEDPCDPNLCVNGDCIPGAVFPAFTCSCNNGFTGTLCNETVDPCEGVTCSGNGMCVVVDAGTGTTMCNCEPGFTGDMCETPINPCNMSPCLNGGTCIPGPFPTTTCQCLPNFSGDSCQNCDLPNCMTCSLIEGICTECFSGYLLAQGICMVNCTICDERETINEVNICNYYCHQQNWAAETSTVDNTFPSFTEPSRNLPTFDKFLRMYSDASTAEAAWNNVVTQASEALVALQPPPKINSILISDWKAAARTWVTNLNTWVQDIRRSDPNFPVFDSDRFLNLLETGDSQVAYESIINEWRILLNSYLDTINE